ncbi:MAG: endonuclease [Flavobacteriia bacterium]|nr:MAG: endonuclease [Flavobacteriia bacterium]
MDHNELGKLGEQIAQNYLAKQGYTILETNWRYLKAEIDIIAQKVPGVIHIVEVKTRNNSFIGNPEEFVTPQKIKLLVSAANEYIVSNDLDAEVQFDIIAIVKNSKYETLNHIENAFYHF